MGYLMGMSTGIGQTLVGHPLDTMTVWQQNKNWEKLTIKNLYRGASVPMIFQGIYGSSVFGIYLHVNKYLKDNRGHSNRSDPWLSGLISGTLSGPILCICDSLKIRRQVSNCEESIFKTIKSGTRGITVTTLLEAPATCIYFGMYNELTNHVNMNPYLAGGISGVIAWISIFPLDTIKTRMQAQKISYRDAIKMGDFFEGIKMCVARSFICNSVAFGIYNFYKNLIDY